MREIKEKGTDMITTVLLDLDDTILDFHASEAVAIVKTFETLGVPCDEAWLARYSQINLEQWRLLETGAFTRDEILVRRFRLLYEEMGIGVDPEATQALYAKNLGLTHFFVTGAEEMLERLSARYDLYLVTNGIAAVQDPRLEASGILPYFKGVFISERVGYMKPQKEYFDAVFSSIGEDRREGSVIVGDSLTSDILGGINAGIPSIWFNLRGNQPRADITPSATITELKDLIFTIEAL